MIDKRIEFDEAWNKANAFMGAEYNVVDTEYFISTMFFICFSLI